MDRLFVEELEGRVVPSILYGYDPQLSASDSGGLVLHNIHVELVFWGPAWKSAANQAFAQRMETGVTGLFNSPFMSALKQYRSTINPGSLAGEVFLTGSNPGSSITDDMVDNLLQARIARGVLPSPASDSQLFYFVVGQPGTSNGGFYGQHSWDTYTDSKGNSTNFHYGYTVNDGTMDTAFSTFSHEMVEAATDPELTAILMNPSDEGVEICDGPAVNYDYRLNGFLVQAYFSQRDRAYIIPTGQQQSFAVTAANTVVVAGNQFSNPDDTIRLARQGRSLLITLNGETAEFDPNLFEPVPTRVDVYPENGVNQITINRTVAVSHVDVRIHGAGVTTLIGPQRPAIWHVTGRNAGTLGPVHFAGIVDLQGGSYSDVFDLSDAAGVTGFIDGGGGQNGLDYSLYTAGHPVQVDLAAGTATNVSGGIRNFMAVRGGAGTNRLAGGAAYSILVGGTGTNILQGGQQSSLLIGGTGPARLVGGDNGNIEIAGHTAYDDNLQVLRLILAEWVRTDETYAQKLAHIRGSVSGGLNGSAHFNASTVTKRQAGDILFGGAGLDWFCVAHRSEIKDLQPGEQVN
jgi:Ca2+-binding RTX toxin-like protein